MGDTFSDFLGTMAKMVAVFGSLSVGVNADMELYKLAKKYKINHQHLKQVLALKQGKASNERITAEVGVENLKVLWEKVQAVPISDRLKLMGIASAVLGSETITNSMLR